MLFRGPRGVCGHTSWDPVSFAFGVAPDCSLNALCRFSIMGNSSTIRSVFQGVAGMHYSCASRVRDVRLEARWGE